MTKNIIIPLVLMCLISFPSWGETLAGLVEREGLYYTKFSDVPFSGKLVVFSDNGQLFTKGNWKNGKREGYWESYYTDGSSLEDAGTYRNGEKVSD